MINKILNIFSKNNGSKLELEKPIENKQEIVTSSESGFGFDTFVNSFQEASSVIKQEVGSAKEQFELINTEIKKIEEIKKKLMNIYHLRIEYPD